MRRSPYTFVVCLSAAVVLVAVISSIYLGLPLKDPDGFLGPAYVRLPLLALMFFSGGVLLAGWQRRGWRQIPTGVVEVVRHEWTIRRAWYVIIGMASFYACYVSYRNLKNDLPIYRTGVLYDKQFLQFDRWLGFGHSPSSLLQSLLGTNIMAEVLSYAYLAYLPLVPVSLGAFLLLSRNVRVGAWYATALCLNWVLGVMSYYALPTLGPAFARPQAFWSLPYTSVTELQDALFRARVDVLADPATSGHIQGVAAFASLHVSVTFAAALFMERTGQRLLLRVVTWVFFGLVVLATLYFGWHYLTDDVAGLIIGWAAVAIGGWVTGNRRHRRRPARPRDDGDPVSLSTASPLRPTVSAPEAVPLERHIQPAGVWAHRVMSPPPRPRSTGYERPDVPVPLIR